MSISMYITDESYKLKLCFGETIPEKPAMLYSARRDTAAFQVIVNTESQYSVTTAHRDWYTEKKQIAGNFKRLRVAVDSPFAAKLNIEEFLRDDDLSEKADMLLNQETRESAANTPTAVWAELAVPEDAKAGEYTVTVKLFASEYNEDEYVVATDTLTLKVFDYLLPAGKDMSFYLDLWQHNSNISRKHDVPLWSDAHFKVIENYVRTLADLGQKSITIIASEIPWSGQGCCLEYKYGGDLYEYSIIGITKELDGSFTYDYSKMQRYIDLCTSYGISGDIEVIGLVNIWDERIPGVEHMVEDHPEAIRLRYLDKADGCMKYMRHTDEVKDYIKSLEQYFINTDQIGRVRVAADEPGNIEKYRVSLGLIHELAPAFRFKTAINHAEFIEEFGDLIDDFAPYIRCASNEYDRLIGYKRTNPEKCFLWYVCCGGAVPNTYIRSSLTEARQIGILTSAMRFDGFLRWNYTVWPEDPRKEIRFNKHEAGDTNFVYPAYNGDVLLSLRYKNLQRGIADFELIEALRKKAGDAAADELISRVLYVKDMNTYHTKMLEDFKRIISFEWKDYNDLKAAILTALS